MTNAARLAALSTLLIGLGPAAFADKAAPTVFFVFSGFSETTPDHLGQVLAAEHSTDDGICMVEMDQTIFTAIDQLVSSGPVVANSSVESLPPIVSFGIGASTGGQVFFSSTGGNDSQGVTHSFSDAVAQSIVELFRDRLTLETCEPYFATWGPNSPTYLIPSCPSGIAASGYFRVSDQNYYCLKR